MMLRFSKEIILLVFFQCVSNSHQLSLKKAGPSAEQIANALASLSQTVPTLDFSSLTSDGESAPAAQESTLVPAAPLPTPRSVPTEHERAQQVRMLYNSAYQAKNMTLAYSKAAKDFAPAKYDADALDTFANMTSELRKKSGNLYLIFSDFMVNESGRAYIYNSVEENQTFLDVSWYTSELNSRLVHTEFQLRESALAMRVLVLFAKWHNAKYPGKKIFAKQLFMLQNKFGMFSKSVDRAEALGDFAEFSLKRFIDSTIEETEALAGGPDGTETEAQRSERLAAEKAELKEQVRAVLLALKEPLDSAHSKWVHRDRMLLQERKFGRFSELMVERTHDAVSDLRVRQELEEERSLKAACGLGDEKNELEALTGKDSRFPELTPESVLFVNNIVMELAVRSFDRSETLLRSQVQSVERSVESAINGNSTAGVGNNNPADPVSTNVLSPHASDDEAEVGSIATSALTSLADLPSLGAGIITQQNTIQNQLPLRIQRPQTARTSRRESTVIAATVDETDLVSLEEELRKLLDDKVRNDLNMLISTCNSMAAAHSTSVINYNPGRNGFSALFSEADLAGQGNSSPAA